MGTEALELLPGMDDEFSDVKRKIKGQIKAIDTRQFRDRKIMDDASYSESGNALKDLAVEYARRYKRYPDEITFGELMESGFAERKKDFGAKTESAVKAFQASVGLTSDGVAGDNTWNALEPLPS